MTEEDRRNEEEVEDGLPTLRAAPPGGRAAGVKGAKKDDARRGRSRQMNRRRYETSILRKERKERVGGLIRQILHPNINCCFAHALQSLSLPPSPPPVRPTRRLQAPLSRALDTRLF